MSDVSVRELCNHGGDVIDRVVRGQHLTITRDGKPVARLVPLGKPPLSIDTLLERWRNLPPMDPDTFRRVTEKFGAVNAKTVGPELNLGCFLLVHPKAQHCLQIRHHV